MSSITKKASNYLNTEREGAETLEYVLIVAILVALVVFFFFIVKEPLEKKIHEVGKHITESGVWE